MNVTAKQGFEISSTSVEQTHALGTQLGRVVQAGDIIALQGDLGAGKTNFVQGLGLGMGITETINSPTFILANEYHNGRLPLYHVDAYRVENAAEADGFGLDDYLNGDGVTVIEWAERVREALPHELLWMEFEYLDETTRRIVFIPKGEQALRLLAEGSIRGYRSSPPPIDGNASIVLLAIDTSTHTSSIALYGERGIVAETTWQSRENHTRSLMPQVVRLLELVGHKANELRAVGVATGPGSFTGLRIGLSAGKGLAFSLNAALIGIPTLDICASAVVHQTLPVCAMLEVGRGRYAAAFYMSNGIVPQRVSDYFFGTAQSLPALVQTEIHNQAPVLVTGEMDNPLRAALTATLGDSILFVSSITDVRRAGLLAALAWKKWQAGEPDDLRTLAPYYVPTASLG